MYTLYGLFSKSGESIHTGVAGSFSFGFRTSGGPKVPFPKRNVSVVARLNWSPALSNLNSRAPKPRYTGPSASAPEASLFRWSLILV